jgi:hypothetical protein
MRTAKRKDVDATNDRLYLFTKRRCAAETTQGTFHSVQAFITAGRGFCIGRRIYRTVGLDEFLFIHACMNPIRFTSSKVFFGPTKETDGTKSHSFPIARRIDAKPRFELSPGTSR